MAALSKNGKADKDELIELYRLAQDAIAEAEQTIATESERMLDLENPDPAQSQVLVATAKVRIETLRKAIPLIQDRIRNVTHGASLSSINGSRSRVPDRCSQRPGDGEPARIDADQTHRGS